MSQVIPVHNPLSDTKLWKVLNEAFKGTEHEPFSKTLASNLIQICEEASIRMKAMSFLHPQYTLHDEKHLLRIVELMSKIISEEVLNSMNPIEISLLILSAYFHDQGMILDKKEYEDLYSDSKFLIFKDDWEIEHPNLKEVQEKSFDKTLNYEEIERCIQTKQELLQILISDYIRDSHAQRSSLFAKSYANDKRLDIAGTNLSSYVAKLCYSHCQAISDLTPRNEYYHDESIGQYKINMPYLALVLRLADILDFDRDRTPDSLYKTIYFNNNISIREWEKHRSVQGWEISPERIRFAMQFEHPTYEKAAREFMDLIDDELDGAKNLLDLFPADSRNYYLKLPSRTDRSRIKPKDNAYVYYDLEFSLSRDEVVKLLMTDNLYDSPSLCVRELLQNSLDALRYRKALIKRDLDADWTQGKIELEHSLDEDGHEILRCTDNGVGMDIDIIKRFLTNVGRSYYRSPEFNRERVSLEKSGCDFDPCSQFGIGFMSCFMIGDRIFIKTRRFYGNNRDWGEPILIDINGLSGMVVVRMGSEDQPVGTTVEIISRKKPYFFSSYDDNVKLLDVVGGYALACEFPIRASCKIAEIRGEISVPPHFSTPFTKLEEAKVEKCKTFSQNFSEIDSQLSGQVRTSILIDKTGKFSIANSEAIWELEDHGRPVLRFPGHDPSKIDYGEQDQICLDGILVCGTPGRPQIGRMLGHWSNNYVFLGRDYFILDVRGKLKPPLTPARTPPRDWKAGPRWTRLEDIAQKAHGRLWEQIVQLIGKDVDDLTFWKLAVIHRAPIQSLRKQVIWDKLSVPVMKNGNEIEWQKISSLGMVRAEEVTMNIGSNQRKSYRFLTSGGNQIAPPDDIIKWEDYQWGGFRHKEEQLYTSILGFCELDLKNGTFSLNLKEPTYSEKVPSDSRFNSTFLLPYSSGLAEYLSVQLPFNNANINHPLVRLAYYTKYLEDLSDIQLFARHMIGYLGNSELWDELENNECTLGHGTRYALRYLGHLASNLSYPEGLQPPYTLLSKNKTTIQIGQKDFERWAKLNSKEE